jgi:cystathionine gamma-synthase
MVVIKHDLDFGHAPHPQTPYAILSNMPGWQTTKNIREGDTSALAKLKHIYPRFLPWSYVGQVS